MHTAEIETDAGGTRVRLEPAHRFGLGARPRLARAARLAEPSRGRPTIWYLRLFNGCSNPASDGSPRPEQHPLRASLLSAGEVMIVEVIGEVDMATAPELARGLAGVTRSFGDSSSTSRRSAFSTPRRSRSSSRLGGCSSSAESSSAS